MVTDRDRSALIVVDMQNDFLAKGGYYDEKAQIERSKHGELSPTDIDYLARVYLHPLARSEIRDAYADFVSRVAEVAATALTQGMTTVFVQTAYDPACVYKPPLLLPNPACPDYGCHPGSWRADFIEPIKSLVAERYAKVIEKHTFDAFFETELRSFLRFQHINTLYVAGVETNVCVLCTALSALSNGFQTVILEDCVTTSQAALQAPTLQIIEVAKGQRMSKQDFLKRLSSSHIGEF
jgi:nicotinamidase-related amidase